MTEHPKIPFPVKGAVEFSGQAQFHPLKFLYAAAKGIPLYDHTRVDRIIDGEIITPVSYTHLDVYKRQE